ncbi:hypothetical protein CYMTET_10786 [Cymbomonas tetramitiformis]|uniref:Uncharacterized protein n=1 Tax=Cymbomonas tetramitiformis TaxID=36881 RepID=A0AAE0GPZ3_9CHLO|nr:hypothetical protein CYMTET_10786 [Cymbomonas tetramitiformis]
MTDREDRGDPIYFLSFQNFTKLLVTLAILKYFADRYGRTISRSFGVYCWEMERFFCHAFEFLPLRSSSHGRRSCADDERNSVPSCGEHCEIEGRRLASEGPSKTLNGGTLHGDSGVRAAHTKLNHLRQNSRSGEERGSCSVDQHLLHKRRVAHAARQRHEMVRRNLRESTSQAAACEVLCPRRRANEAEVVAQPAPSGLKLHPQNTIVLATLVDVLASGSAFGNELFFIFIF